MTSTPQTAGGYVVLTGVVEAEDDGFNAYCPELGVATCGDTVAEVLDGLADAIRVYIADWDDPADLEADVAAKGRRCQNNPAIPRLRYRIHPPWKDRAGLYPAGSRRRPGLAGCAPAPAAS